MNWKDVLGKVAPTVATLLGGPLAGLAVSQLGGVLGLTETPTVDNVQAALEKGQLTGDQIVAIRKLEADTEIKLKELGLRKEELEVRGVELDNADRNSARDREKTVLDWTPRVLAYLVTMGFFSVLAYLLVEGKPAVGGDVMMVMLGSLGTAWTTIIAYYFGSSHSSSMKTELLAGYQPRPSVGQPTIPSKAP